MVNRTLTPKQQAFVDQYLMDLNGRQAAIRAGYAPRNAGKQASTLFRNPRVAEAIARAMEKRSELTHVDATLVLVRLLDMLDADPAQILNDDGTLKPITRWPVTWRRMLSGFEIAELWEGRGRDRERVGVLKKIKLIDRLKVIELLGKHIDVGAFKEMIEHTGKLDLATAVREARERKVIN